MNNKSFNIALALILALIQGLNGKPITDPDQQAIIMNKHNELRRMAAKGELSDHGFGTATKMYPLTWDDELANNAEKLASTCRERDGAHSCQSIAMDDKQDGIPYNSREEAIIFLQNKWINDINMNTQIVDDNKFRIGCALNCDCNGKYYLVCDYNPNSNYKDEVYTLGNTASECPNGNDDGLCLGSPQTNNPPRKNEDECSKRRCCSMRDELTEYDLPEGLNCRTLSDHECGQHDSYCEWDCQEVNPARFNKNIQRKYRGISYKTGEYKPCSIPDHNDDDNDNDKLLQKCLADGAKFISIDDCGVEYEEEIKDYDVICHQLYGSSQAEDKNDQHRRLNVFGADGRTQVNNMDVYPYDTVLSMESDTTTGDWGCTATMISPDIAITAAHCVWGNGDLLDVKFYWSIDSCNEQNANRASDNYYHVAQAWIIKAYMQPGGDNAANDIALVQFNTNKRDHNYMGFGYNFDQTAEFRSIGYPADKSDGCTPYEQSCKYQDFYRDTMVSTECDHWHGQSGSAITQNGKIYGILSSGTDTENIDCRMTADKVAWICEYTGTCN